MYSVFISSSVLLNYSLLNLWITLPIPVTGVIWIFHMVLIYRRFSLTANTGKRIEFFTGRMNTLPLIEHSKAWLLSHQIQVLPNYTCLRNFLENTIVNFFQRDIIKWDFWGGLGIHTQWCSEVTIWDATDWTTVGYVKGKLPNHCAITLNLVLFMKSKYTPSLNS